MSGGAPAAFLSVSVKEGLLSREIYLARFLGRGPGAGGIPGFVSPSHTRPPAPRPSYPEEIERPEQVLLHLAGELLGS